MRVGILKVFIVAVVVLNFPRSGNICILSSDSHVKADNLFLENKCHCNIMMLMPENAFGDTLAGEKGEKRVVSGMGNKKETQERKVEQDSNRGVMIKVTLIVIFVWLILGIYLFIIDRKVSRLEKMIDEL